MNYTKSAATLKAIAHPLRLNVMVQLLSGSKTVSELLEGANVGQPNLSQHLGRMRAAGVVTAVRAGTSIHYSIATPEIKKAVRAVAREMGPK